jgi:glucan-binding YG repeat protein
MRAGKGHSSQILAMILSLILAAGSLIMPVFGEQTTQNAEESIVVETDNESEDEAEAPENLEDASETEQESVDESSEDAAVQTEEKEAVSNDNAVETGSSEQATVDSDTDATVEEDLDESSDGQDTQSQSSEEITEEPAQGTVSTEAQYEDAGDLDPISIEDAEVTGITDKIYDGSEQTQTLVVKYGEQTLVENQDYEVYYSNNIEVGTAYVYIYGIGRYTSMIEKTFSIFSIKHVGWYEEYGYWYYADENGEDVTGWKLIGGKWYYFYDSGEMATGTEYIDGSYYHLTDSGAMFTGWYKEYGDWYYYLSNGKRASGWQLISGKWYYFDDYMYSGGEYQIGNAYYRFTNSGAMYTGWYKDSDGDWNYYLPSGKQASGWQLISGKWYYFFNGYMYSDGEYNIGNATYRFNKSGAMITGWYKYSDGDWSYYLSSGKLATGWQKIGGKWYYFDKYGWMENDCIKIIGGKGYKFAKSGYLMYANTTGWVKIYDGNGNLDYAYYVSSGGALTVGWKKIGGKWYYFDTYDCEMENDEWPRTINNKGYYFRSNGVMQGESGGWIKRDSYYWYYANKGGSLVTGWKKLNGKWYYFDASGAYNMYRGGTYKINQKSYTFYDNGVCKNK